MKNMSTIIPVSTAQCQVNSWKNLLKSATSDPNQLLAQVGLNPESFVEEIDSDNAFAMRVPRPYIDKMRYGDRNDPLLLQVLSQQQENVSVDGYGADPLLESQIDTPGLLHKYHGRVLLILSSACAVNCRYCFRRHFPYQDKMASGQQLEASLRYIEQSPSISEVILSGGDPLIISDDALRSLITKLESIPHLKRLRIHTRLPVVIPQRITKALCQVLTTTRLQTSMVLHINHGNEIDSLLANALSQLTEARVQLLNQSVLLKGINDSADTLVELSEKLFSVGVLPYYLHLLDKVAGAAHFDLDQTTAKTLVKDIRSRLPGYLVPRLAREEAGKEAKTVIA